MKGSVHARGLSQAQQAQRHWAALCLLDAHASERAELRAAGVGEGRIQVLYGPMTEAILAALPNRYAAEGCPPAIRNSDYTRELNFTIEEVTDALTADMRMAMAAELTSGSATKHVNDLTELYKVLISKPRNCWGRKPKHPGETLAAAIWFACWAMANRPDLPRKCANRVDQLVVWLAKNALPNGAIA